MHNFQTLIKPAILSLIAETEERGHRRERDLHHHLTLCLNRLEPLRLGRPDRLVRYEEPTAQYRWRGSDAKAGNLDFCLPAGTSLEETIALELNLDYTNLDKIKQDFIKILDPRNRHGEAVYFACALRPHRRSFKDSVQEGLNKACRALREGQLNLSPFPEFLVPVKLHILVVETYRTHNGLYRLLWEACPTEPCLSDELTWIQASFQPVSQPVATLVETTNRTHGELDRDEAARINDEKMQQAGIPLNSTTARCMLHATEDSRGRKRCQLGPTPLWENCLHVVDGKVCRSEFMCWIERLIESGHKFQKAGQASHPASAAIG